MGVIVGLVIVLFAACFARALCLFDRREPVSGLAYLLVGVSGLFASMIIGIPLLVS